MRRMLRKQVNGTETLFGFVDKFGFMHDFNKILGNEYMPVAHPLSV